MQRHSLSIVVLLLLLVSPLVYPGDSVARSDSFSSVLINPAAAAYEEATGFGFGISGDVQGGVQRGQFFLNLRNIGYWALLSENSWNHYTYLSFSPLPNSYLGISLSTADEDLVFKGGMIYRPLDLLSFGATASLRRDGWSQFRLGLGVQPFSALRISGDLRFEDGGLSFPGVSAALRVGSSLRCSLSYNIPDSSLSIGLGLFYRSFRTALSGEAGPDPSFNLSGGFSPHLMQRPAPSGDEGAVEYTFSEGIRELPRYVRFASLRLSAGGPNLLLHKQRLRCIAADPDVRTVLIDLRQSIESFVQLRELLGPLRQIRESGKRLVFYFEHAKLYSYLLAAASGADIYLHPAGSIGLKGLYVEKLFLGDFLKKYGIEVENYASHSYKTAYDNLSRGRMSEQERFQLRLLLMDLHSSLIEFLKEGRDAALDAEQGKELLARGPYLIAEEAKEAGLIDGIIRKEALVQSLGGVDSRYCSDPLFPRNWHRDPSCSIALISLKGPIHSGGGVFGESIGSESALRRIATAGSDPSIDAIVLRIDSGGGELIASDRIASLVRQIREDPQGKPLVVSMAGTAASGGYYIAMFADRVYLYPETLTGSIGVIAIRPNISGLLEEFSLHPERVELFPSADFTSPFRGSSPGEEEKLRRKIAHSYALFTDLLADARGLSGEEVDALAQGRVWSGRRALELGLADAFGGIEEACRSAAELAAAEQGRSFDKLKIAEYGEAGGETQIPEAPGAVQLFSLMPYHLEY